jgi:hypothetical protein
MENLERQGLTEIKEDARGQILNSDGRKVFRTSWSCWYGKSPSPLASDNDQRRPPDQRQIGQERRGEGESYPNNSILILLANPSRLRRYNARNCTFVTSKIVPIPKLKLQITGSGDEKSGKAPKK